MNHFPHIIKNARSFLFIKTAIIILVMSACKNDDDIEEPFPVFKTCKAVTPKGNLSISGDSNNMLLYITNGGGTIKYLMETHAFIFSHAVYPGFKIEFWGGTDDPLVSTAAHENLNGKQIKDKLGVGRSMVFPDGSKVTLVSDKNSGELLWASIYDGHEFHRINLICNTIEYSSVNSVYAKQLDDAEADGETATFEFTETGLLFLNVYTEDEVGQKVEERVLLGEIFKDEPTIVNDYYDDPRLGHT